MLKKIPFYIFLLIFTTSTVLSQEAKKQTKQPSNINAINADPIGRVNVNGSSGNLMTISEQFDESGAIFGVINLQPATDKPAESDSITNRLWKDPDEDLAYGGNIRALRDIIADNEVSANTIRIRSGAGPNKVLTSIGTNGLASWQTPTSSSSGSINGLSDGRSLETIITNRSLFLGEQAGNSDNNGNTSGGNNNTGIGIRALYSNTTGDWNVALGSRTLELSQATNRNTALGYESLKNLTTSGANDNVAIGYSSLKNSIGGIENTAVGSDAMLKYIASAYGNTSLGYQSLYGGAGVGAPEATGHNNTALGYQTLYKNKSGFGNVAIGYQAGFNKPHDENNKLYIHNSNIVSPLIYGDFGTFDVTINGDLAVTGSYPGSSDIRLKTNIVPILDALKGIKSLNAINYHWKYETIKNKRFDVNKLQVGVIAQDVEKVFPELVDTDEAGYKTVDYVKLSVMTLQAIKEQQEIIEELKKNNSEVSSKNLELEERLSKIENLLDSKRFTIISN